MDLLKKLLRQGTPSSTEISVTLFEGTEPLEVKGESYYQDALRRTVRDHGRDVVAVLVPEPDNEYDSNAVAVWVGGGKAGYLSREDASLYQRAVMELTEMEGQPIALQARIVGGEAARPSFGIWLQHDPSDFGVEARNRSSSGREQGSVLTGRSSSGLEAWFAELPTDRLSAIRKLREFLTDAAAPLERHYMYNELEELLYKSRDVFDSALAEFEDACRSHDAEMDTILPALKREFGGVPALPTYKQAAIMKQKAHDFEGALGWAQRGLDLYGKEGMRPDWADDLRKRAESYGKKLA